MSHIVLPGLCRAIGGGVLAIRRISWWLAAILVTAMAAASGCGQSGPSEPATTYGGTAVGFTDEGDPYRGDLDAPVTLFEYSDLLCPFCARHHEQTWPALLEQYVREGTVLYVFRDMPLAGLHPTAAQGHVAARCVGEQGPALYWEMHDTLFANQSQWSGIADPGAYLAGVAEDVGADSGDYADCIASGRNDGPVSAGISAGSALGFSGTPSFQFVDNRSGASTTLVR